MSELKACPFCNVNEWKYQSHFSGTTIYQCEKCGTIVEEWVINIRPIEDALQAENERLKEELQQEKTRSQLNLEAEERRMLNITYYCAEIDRLTARIAELEAAQRWIPVSESPKEDGEYFTLSTTVLLHSCPGTSMYSKKNNVWWDDGTVTHWMPLPKLPEVQDV